MTVLCSEVLAEKTVNKKAPEASRNVMKLGALKMKIANFSGPQTRNVLERFQNYNETLSGLFQILMKVLFRWRCALAIKCF